MTVAELIQELETRIFTGLDPKTEVWVGSCGGSGKMDTIRTGEYCSDSICPDNGILLESENS